MPVRAARVLCGCVRPGAPVCGWLCPMRAQVHGSVPQFSDAQRGSCGRRGTCQGLSDASYAAMCSREFWHGSGCALSVLSGPHEGTERRAALSASSAGGCQPWSAVARHSIAELTRLVTIKAAPAAPLARRQRRPPALGRPRPSHAGRHLQSTLTMAALTSRRPVAGSRLPHRRIVPLPVTRV